MKGEGDEEADGRTEENMRHACRAGMEGTNRNSMYCDSGRKQLRYSVQWSYYTLQQVSQNDRRLMTW